MQLVGMMPKPSAKPVFAGRMPSPNPDAAITRELRKALKDKGLAKVDVAVKEIDGQKTIILQVESLSQGIGVIEALKPMLEEKPGLEYYSHGKKQQLKELFYRSLPVRIQQKTDPGHRKA